MDVTCRECGYEPCECCGTCHHVICTCPLPCIECEYEECICRTDDDYEDESGCDCLSCVAERDTCNCDDSYYQNPESARYEERKMDVNFLPNDNHTPLQTLRQRSMSIGKDMFGLELEIVLEHVFSGLSDVLKEEWRAKCDGSIPDCGREFVFQRPTNFEKALENVKNLYSFFAASNIGLRDFGCAGTHIHVNLHGISDDAIKRSALLIESTKKDNNLFKMLAGRLPTYYSSRNYLPLPSAFNILEKRHKIKRFKKYMLRHYSSHSCAMSMSQSYPTVEFRIFKTSTTLKDAVNALVTARMLVHETYNPRKVVEFCEMRDAEVAKCLMNL